MANSSDNVFMAGIVLLLVSTMFAGLRTGYMTGLDHAKIKLTEDAETVAGTFKEENKLNINWNLTSLSFLVSALVSTMILLGCSSFFLWIGKLLVGSNRFSGTTFGIMVLSSVPLMFLAFFKDVGWMANGVNPAKEFAAFSTILFSAFTKKDTEPPQASDMAEIPENKEKEQE